jgi:hypothetical protein
LKYDGETVTSPREGQGEIAAIAEFTHPRFKFIRTAHVTLTALFQATAMEPKRPLVVDPELLNTPRPTKSPAKKLLKYVVSLGLLWYILHRWLFLLAFNASAHDLYSWAIDAFGPKENGLTNSQLTENFFLYALLLPSYRCH